MYKEKKILALIPARSGSKGVKDKNIKDLNGKPLIAYTLEAAAKSEVFDRIIVSTDSKKYANIAKQYGGEIPFLRPKELAEDESSSEDVIRHALKYLKENGENFDYIMILQPTSPLRSEEDIINSLKLMDEKNAEAVISVTKTDHPPDWSNTLPENHSMYNFLNKKVLGKRRQDLPQYYRLNGAIFLSKIVYTEENKNGYTKETYAYIMPRERSIDIDTKIDFELAKIYIKKNIRR